MRRSTKRILVSIPTFAQTQRLKLEGILRYARDKKGDTWRLQLDIGGFTKQCLLDLTKWQCDGVIAYVDDPRKRELYAASVLPTVLIDPFLTPDDEIARRDNVVTFINNHFAEGQTAARHLLDRHFEHFAYVGTPEPTVWSDRRGEGFVAELTKNGKRCVRYPQPRSAAREDFAAEMPLLMRWLQKLPRPTAIFAAHDIRARQIFAAADAARIDIPNHVAVLGVDDDALVCETAVPPLSSIPTNDVSLGFACGRALEELICRRARGRSIVTNHTRVISRVSTDITAIGDPFVARALSWARNHLAEGISADSLAEKIGYSKRMLQQRAYKALGTTLGDEIRKMRLTAAAELLANTAMSITGVADACGFSNVSHLSMRFAESYRMTPMAYRKAHANVADVIVGER